ncbi:lytic murein transglycosylase B [Deferribacterales bacterium RsTz2092]
MKHIAIILFLLIFSMCTCHHSYAYEVAKKRTNPISQYKDVQKFIADVSKRNNLNKKALEKTFSTIKFDYAMLERMNTPAEKRTWSYYLGIMVNDERISNGKKYLSTHNATLTKAYKEYHVPNNVLTALLGVETNFGEFKLKYRALQSLSTFAFEYPRRAKYFKEELEALLVFANKQNTESVQYLSSYAGAIGIPQFMPSNIKKYAVDGDGDGLVDIVTNHDDAIMSVGNYLKDKGWQENKPHVATVVSVPNSLDNDTYKTNPCNEENMRSIGEYREMGIKIPPKYKSKEIGMLAKLAEDSEEGMFEAVIFFENACPIHRYNKSLKYVMTIALLAEAINE